MMFGLYRCFLCLRLIMPWHHIGWRVHTKTLTVYWHTDCMAPRTVIVEDQDRPLIWIGNDDE